MQRNYKELYEQKWTAVTKALSDALSTTKQHWMHLKNNSTDDEELIFFSHVLYLARKLESDAMEIFEDVMAEFEIN